MSKDTEANYKLILKTSLAENLSKKECKALAEIVSIRELKKGELLLKEGKVDDCLCVIVKGRLAVTRDVGGGEYVVIHTLKTGDLAGAMGFVDGAPHSASLRAHGDAVVYRLPRDRFESLVETQPKLVYQVMRAIICSVHASMQRMNQEYVEMSNYIMKAHGRY